jgi:hypothetical protein
VAQVVERPLCKFKALSSNLSPTPPKKKKRKKRKDEAQNGRKYLYCTTYLTKDLSPEYIDSN